MGCDIHSFAENKVNGKWKFIKEINIDRNYDLFSILANVRNGYGFARVKTGEGFNPMCEPKGVPLDASRFYRSKVEAWGSDAHSHSYLTLKELKDFDWGQTTLKQGVITLTKYKELREKGGSPDSWCGFISGLNIVTVDEDEADEILINPTIKGDKDIRVKYRWSITYKDICSYFIDFTVKDLQALGKDENVRIVFFFDN